jgi:hypothetical protein
MATGSEREDGRKTGAIPEPRPAKYEKCLRFAHDDNCENHSRGYYVMQQQAQHDMCCSAPADKAAVRLLAARVHCPEDMQRDEVPGDDRKEVH